MMGRLLLELCGLVSGLVGILLLIWWLEDDFAEDLGSVSKGWRKDYWMRKGADDEE